jgi:hypothetical protein
MCCARPAALALTLLLAGCGGGGGGGSSTLELLPGQWTWIDVAGTTCADGSPTGIAVNPATARDSMVVIFLDAGGACWESSGFACPGFTSGGPFGRTQLEALEADGFEAGTILDRKVTGTPFGGATLVFVPYCTGDVHWGDATRSYPGFPAWHHAGKANLEADVEWLGHNLRAPEKLVVIGSSAGGFGSLLAHDLARQRWPDAKGYVVDDSGPPLIGAAIPQSRRDEWYASWDLAHTLDPLCGVVSTSCNPDLSQAIGALRARYPQDRIALLSSLQDLVIRGYIGRSAGEYQTALLDLVDQRFSTATPSVPGAHAFLVEGSGHGLFSDVESWTVAGTSLPEWLNQMIDDDPGWTTLGRPAP